MNESRTKNSIKNTFFAAVNMTLQFILKFAVRIVFVRFLAIEYLGLNTLFSNILQVLSLAELGVGQAIVYSLYKPIAENDTDKVKSLIAVYKKFYFVVGIFIIVVGLAIIPALPYLMSGDTDLDINLNAVYVIYLLNTAITYFFAHRRALVFANQRNDIETKVSSVCLIGLNVTQLILLALTKNYLLFISVMPLFTLLEALILSVISFRLYPEIRGKAEKLDAGARKDLLKNTAAMMGHKLGGVAVSGTDNIFISSFIGLNVLGIYSNYTLIVSSLTSVMTLFITATRASIGNLVTSESRERAYEVFNRLNWLFFVVLGIFFCCCITLVQDFIRLVFGHDLRLDFVTMLLVFISFYVTQSRVMVLSFKETTGLFWNDRFKPLFEAGINLALDFLLVIYMGLPGIILATIISNVLCNITVEPYVVFKHYFYKNIWLYYLKYFLYTGAIGMVCALTYFVCSFVPVNNIGYLIGKGILAAGLSFVCLTVLSFPTKEFHFWRAFVFHSLFRRSK